jgi:hypothetical protein
MHVNRLLIRQQSVPLAGRIPSHDQLRNVPQEHNPSDYAKRKRITLEFIHRLQNKAEIKEVHKKK